MRRRFGMLLRGEKFDCDLREEMRLHIELREQEMMAAGLSKEDARRSFGNEMLLREVSGDAWGWRGLEHVWQDLRYGARALWRTPGFTAVAVIALALGIGANTAIFSLVDAVLLKPLAYRDADRLVTLLHQGANPVAAGNYVDWREQSRSFTAMGAAEAWGPNVTGNDPPEHLRGLHVTESLLPMLGIRPMLGRVFTEEGKHEVVLSHGLWQRRFGGRREVLGQAMTLDGESYTVVGVMPAAFQFAPFWATRTELWAPIDFGEGIHNRGGNSLRVFARLKPGVEMAQARAEIAALTGRLEQQYPGTNRGVLVTPLKENVTGKIETPLLLLLGAGGFVLLIACANVAHMLLARTSGREKEIAVRRALGAGRGRVIGQFLTENLLLAALGALAGLLLAEWGISGLVRLSPAYIPRVETVGMDARVVLFLIGVTVVTALVFGLAPAVQGAAANLSGALKEGGRGGSDGVRRNRLRSFLVASEFALAFMLLVGAGLMIRSLIALESLDPGFDPRKVLSMVVSVAGTEEADPKRRVLFYRELLDRVRALPGVTAASGINHLPLAGDMWGYTFQIEGRPKPRVGESPSAVYRVAMPGYFETMRLPVRRGRGIGVNDDERAPGVVVINERAAKLYWAGEDAVGKRITLDGGKTWVTVIGIAANAKQVDWAADSRPELYLSGLQSAEFLGGAGTHSAYLTLVVRAAGHAGALTAAVKKTVWSFDRNLPISEVLEMEDVVARANAQPRFEMLLLMVFAGVALVLAGVGIYGVMSYAVTRRTREIGIRISLGASRGEVLRMVVRQGMVQALAGTVVGVAGALLLSGLMGKLLYGVRATDPATFTGVGMLLGTVAMMASFVPARKAMRVDPVVALREE